MSNSPENLYQPISPEYQIAVDELFSLASDTMDANTDLITYRDLYREATVSSLRLESDLPGVILLERSLKNPLPKEPDWSSVTPSILKITPGDQGNRYVHQYIDVHGLIIARRIHETPSRNRWVVSNSTEDELNVKAVRRLTDEIRTWVPMEQIQTKRSRVARFIGKGLSKF